VTVFEAIFQALFSYRPIIFEQGDLRLDPSVGSYVAAVLVLGVVIAAVLTLRGTGGRGRPRDHVVLLTLRVAALAIVLLCLFRPLLVVKAAVAQQNVLGVLLDDSRSMRVPDWNGQPRGRFIEEQFGGPDAPIIKALSERFLVRTFHFSSTALRADGEAGLTFAGSQTRIGEALEAARQELAGLPVAGLVLVTDGADTSNATITESLLGMKAQKLPVFTVGIGVESLEKDIQIDRVEVPASVLKGTSLLVDVTIRHTGYAGQTVVVDVEDEGRIIGSETVRLSLDGVPSSVRVRLMAAEAGPRVFRFRVPPQPDEIVTENNVREATIVVRDVKDKVLYYEGEPRFEMKFIRRAVADDENLQLVVLQRTADNKYFRAGVDDGEELAAGFPKTRDELFAYRALILGSVEAGAFSGDQLRMISEFVDKRGGGLLMIGGARAFSEGGYAGTPVADVLPVVIEAARGPSLLDVEDGGLSLARLRVSPTREGLDHAATQIANTPEASEARWKELPQVTSVNDITAVKSGATTLLEGIDEGGRSRVVLAAQRYGRGKALAFTLQDSWLWQMHVSMSLEDQTHENLWRQLIRWLVDGVPAQVEARALAERVEPGESVTVEATVVDASFVELNDATVTATVTTPEGDAFDLALQWTGDRAGRYRGSFVSGSGGRYQLRVEGRRDGESLGMDTAWVTAEAGNAEHFDATRQTQALERIAEETGGRSYTPANVASLAEDVRYDGRGVTTEEERELWHMPIVLLTLIALVCVEWGYRRGAGLA